MAFGVDFAWGRPGVPALEHAGVKFCCRYLSHDTTGKNLTRSEADELSRAGLWIAVVWETTADRALGGHAAGVADAQAAGQQARDCGMPADRPVYFAVDWDAGPSDQPAIDAYLRGAASVLGTHRVGLYAGYGPIHRAFDNGTITWGWQTYAWSAGQWDHRAQLHQYSNDHIIGGVGLDYDVNMTGDYGQWQVGRSPGGQPGPTPQPAVQEDGDMGPIEGKIPAGFAYAADGVKLADATKLDVACVETQNGGASKAPAAFLSVSVAGDPNASARVRWEFVPEGGGTVTSDHADVKASAGRHFCAGLPAKTGSVQIGRVDNGVAASADLPVSWAIYYAPRV